MNVEHSFAKTPGQLIEMFTNLTDLKCSLCSRINCAYCLPCAHYSFEDSIQILPLIQQCIDSHLTVYVASDDRWSFVSREIYIQTQTIHGLQTRSKQVQD